jgi:hypothetical protein
MKLKLSFIAVLICMLNVNMSNAQLAGAIADRLAAKKAIKDQGITNEVHKNHVGQIVWANEKISFTNPDANKFKSDFTTDEWIFGRFYLSESIQNSIRKEKKKVYENLYYYYDVYVDGTKVDWEIEAGQLYGEYLERTTQQLYVCTEEGSDRAGWQKLVNNLKPGVHQIKVDLKARKNELEFKTILATGTFNLTVNQGDKVKIGTSYSTIKAGMEDAELEAKILSCIQLVAKNSAWDEKFTKVKIQNEDWDIQQNKYSGVATGRSVVAYCFASWPDGHCTVQRFVFKQKYDGQNYGKAIYYDGLISGSQEKVDCE